MTVETQDVERVQRALIACGYNLGSAGADGDAGPLTIAALTAYQRTAGLLPDGILGPKTRAALLADAQPASLRAEPAEPAWLTLARGDIGTVEGVGKSNNPKVVRFFADAGFAGVKDDAVAWCAASVGAWLTRAGRKPSGSLAARSYEFWGVGLAEPRLGCIGVKRRGSSSWQGHVGIVVGASRDKVLMVGGNQGDAVTIAAFPRSEFTGFRWPADVPLPSASTLPTTIAGAKTGVSEA